MIWTDLGVSEKEVWVFSAPLLIPIIHHHRLMALFSAEIIIGAKLNLDWLRIVATKASLAVRKILSELYEIRILIPDLSLPSLGQLYGSPSLLWSFSLLQDCGYPHPLLKVDSLYLQSVLEKIRLSARKWNSSLPLNWKDSAALCAGLGSVSIHIWGSLSLSLSRIIHSGEASEPVLHRRWASKYSPTYVLCLHISLF